MISQDLREQLTTCKVYSNIAQADDEASWLRARTGGIGGSDVGAICGVSPFSSAKQIYFSKTGQYQDVLGHSDAANERMHFGHMLEPIVANEYYERELKETNRRLVDISCTMQRIDEPWALANVDRLIVEDFFEEDGKTLIRTDIVGILECKTTSEYMNDEWESGDILESYIYQLNWYMWILGIEKGTFACLVGGNKFYSYDVFRNDELLETEIIPKAKSFWFDNVLKLVEPEMQANDKEIAGQLYSDVVKGSEITFTDDVTNELVKTIQDCKAKIKELTKIQQEAENKIKDKMKENEIAQTRDYTVKWGKQSQTRVDTALFKTNFPDIYKQVSKVTSFRVMRITGGVDNE